jgi:hypothetical protein
VRSLAFKLQVLLIKLNFNTVNIYLLTASVV